jgi:HEAT repeat protein
MYFIILLIINTTLQCGTGYESPFDEKVRQITDAEIEQYISTICLELGGHIGLEAVGHCGQCGGMTPCCNMQICDACAAAQGVCPFCLKKVDWTKNTDPETEIPLLLAILARSDNQTARQVAIHALTQIKHEGTLKAMMKYSNEKMLSLELSRAVGEFKDKHYIGYCKKVLKQYSSDDYFGDDDDDIEMQYYLSNAVQAAAASLAQIGTKKAVDVLIHSATKGKLWERCFAIKALGSCNDTRVTTVLNKCLKEFFAKDRDWKWIPGRDLIGATLQSLANTGDRESALLLIHYIRNPGCDFLYEELKACLSRIGQQAVPELIAALQEDFDKEIFDWGRLALLEALGNIDDSTVVPFLVETLHWQYPDQYFGGDFKSAALQALGTLQAHEAFDDISHELMSADNEYVRQAAARALGKIGGTKAFNVLIEKLKQSDNEWVIRECLSSLTVIAFDEIKTDEAKLTACRIMAEKSGVESAFQLLYQPVLDGETWPVELFFDVLAAVPMKRNFYNVCELVHTPNKQVFDKTVTFLNQLTGLKTKIKFGDSNEKKRKAKNTYCEWYQKHYDKL